MAVDITKRRLGARAKSNAAQREVKVLAPRTGNTRTITKAGTYTLVAAPAGNARLQVLSGTVTVKSPVTLTFSYMDPDIVVQATSSYVVNLPTGLLPVGYGLTIQTSANTQVKVTWSTKVIPAIVVPPTPEAPLPVDCVVSAWSAWSAWAEINETEEARTRTRTVVTSPINGGAACPTLSEQQTRLIPAPSGEKRVLSLSDMTYLGAMRVPDSGVDMFPSYGVMTGRKVNGQVRLFLTGRDGAGDPLYEFADTGSYGATAATAPRMTLVRAWGDIYDGRRVSWYPDGSERGFGAQFMAGLHWSETTQLLYWTYYETYNVTGVEDWTLGATKLHDNGTNTAYGPWRTEGEGKKGPFRCLHMAEHPTSGEMLCGSRQQSGNGNAPWGPDLWVGQFPLATTPSGFGAPDIPLQKYVTYYPMFSGGSGINADGSWLGDLRACRRPGTYIFEPIPNITLTEIDPTKNGGTGTFTSLDGLAAALWIDLPDVHGVLFTGTLAAGHVWYRNAGGGNDLCTHGVASPIDITGPVATELQPTMVIMDPDDLTAVRAGSTIDYTVDPASFINAEAVFGIATAGIGNAGAGKKIAGTYFDAETRKLYVCAPMADATIAPSFLMPLVHVFQIA